MLSFRGTEAFTRDTSPVTRGEFTRPVSRGVFVTMMESTDLWNGNDVFTAGCISPIVERVVFFKRQMSARTMVIVHVRFQQSFQRTFVGDNDVMKTFATD